MQKYNFLGAKQWKKELHITGQGLVHSGILYKKNCLGTPAQRRVNNDADRRSLFNFVGVNCGL